MTEPNPSADPASVPQEPPSTEEPPSRSNPVEPTESKPLPRASFLFFGVVASVSLVLDVASKSWAAMNLEGKSFRGLASSQTLIDDHLFFTWALNKGGAWGLLQNQSEMVRKPFFLAVSVLAIAFIVSLYSRLLPSQRALRWGLPLVLGGALGNLADRIVRGKVIDFIDYRADWVATVNTFVRDHLYETWSVTDHWPTFNVADISICIGVGLMAVDMVTSKRQPEAESPSEPSAAGAASKGESGSLEPAPPQV